MTTRRPSDGDRSMRYPAVAGGFYERSRDARVRQVTEGYTQPVGPGRVPEVRKGERRLVRLVVPHAGYMYSGPVAAHSYAALAADGWPRSFVILGPNHHGQGAPLALTKHDWQTPLGSATVDVDLHAALSKPPLTKHDWQTPLGSATVDVDLHAALSKPPLEEDILAHRDEHS